MMYELPVLRRTGVCLLHAEKQSATTGLEEEVIRVDLGVGLHHSVEEIRVEEDLVEAEEEGEFWFCCCLFCVDMRDVRQSEHIELEH